MALLETLLGPIRSDPSRCVPSISAEHAAAHNGDVFYLYHLVTLSAAAVSRVHLRTGSRQIHLRENGVHTEGPDTLMELFAGRTATLDASPAGVVPVCTNQVRLKESGTRLYTNSAVGTTGGLLIRQKWAFGVEGGGPSPGAGEDGSDSWALELVLPPHTDYVLELSRPGGSGAARVHLALAFYEVGPVTPAPT